jgi:GGDEF domain-containing protein
MVLSGTLIDYGTGSPLPAGTTSGSRQGARGTRVHNISRRTTAATKMPNSLSEDSPFRAGVLPETEVLLAGQDLLTGLSSRAGLEAHFRFAVARARRSGARLAVGVAVVEVDPDAPNDEVFGHDLAVIEAAKNLRRELRETDVIARVAETRFAFIAEEVSESALPSIVNRLSRVLQRTKPAPGELGRRLVGLALWDNGEQTLPALLRAAEEALRAPPANDPDAAWPEPDAAMFDRWNAPRTTGLRTVARRTLGWASLAALLALAVLAAPAEWRNQWLPLDGWARLAWSHVNERLPGAAIAAPAERRL